MWTSSLDVIIHKVLLIALFGVDSTAIKCEVNFPSQPALFIGEQYQSMNSVYYTKRVSKIGKGGK